MFREEVRMELRCVGAAIVGERDLIVLGGWGGWGRWGLGAAVKGIEKIGLDTGTKIIGELCEGAYFCYPTVVFKGCIYGYNNNRKKVIVVNAETLGSRILNWLQQIYFKHSFSN